MRTAIPRITERTDALTYRLQREHDSQKKLRLQMLSLLASGQAHTRQDVAHLLGGHRNTIGRWLVIYAAGGLDALLVTDVPAGKPISLAPGVLKELTVFAIVYNLVRLVMWQSATLQHTAVERISFLDALRWLSAPSTGMPLGALIVNPARPHRVEPRVKKRRPKPFPWMIKPRQELRQQLIQPALSG